MGSVPNNTTYCLTDVIAAVVPLSNDLLAARNAAVACGGFDPTYGGSCNSMLNFRNWNTPTTTTTTTTSTTTTTTTTLPPTTTTTSTTTTTTLPPTTTTTTTSTSTTTTSTTTAAPGMHCIYNLLESQSCCSTCDCTCWRYTSNPTMGASDCFDITFSWALSKTFTTGPAVQCFDIFCNGGTKGTCSIFIKGTQTCSGTFSSFTWVAGDLVEVITKAEITDCTTESSGACVYISNVACISSKGCYCLGFPSMSCAITGAIV